MSLDCQIEHVMPETTESITFKLRCANSLAEATALTGELFADVVTMHFVPPRPGDGPRDKGGLIEEANAELAALTRAMTDMRQSIADVSIVGKEIHFSTVLEGTLADGAKVYAKRHVSYAIRDGEITGMTVYVDAKAAEVLRRAYAASGLQATKQF